ncbi:MAG: DsbA family protein [Actinomycetota bacterium]|nr:DsbA family protein [Actinomycetota bacterium]
MLDFAVTWDYRCPFARNAHEHLITGLGAGAPWQVRFLPFSLNQVHVEPGGPDVWEEGVRAPDLLAMQVGIVVRDRFPASFLALHAALFAARHDEGRDLRDEAVLAEVLAAHGLSADAVFAEMAHGWPLEVFRKEHEAAVTDHQVFGVPTFIAGGSAVFVRLLDRPGADVEQATRTIERVVDLATGWPQLNELKHTSIPR